MQLQHLHKGHELSKNNGSDFDLANFDVKTLPSATILSLLSSEQKNFTHLKNVQSNNKNEK